MPDYNDSVFINCPFDDGYKTLFRAIIFTVYRCGFYPLSALSEDDGTDNRLAKIERLIESCKYGIHDISKTESNTEGLPRFNMPFELGVFFGAKRFGMGEQKNKVGIIFDIERYRYLKFISDINGVDIRPHDGKYNATIIHIRNWLKTASRRVTILGPNIIVDEYEDFLKNLPAIVAKLGFDIDHVTFNDYCSIVEEAIKQIIADKHK